ncbi:MAG: hypothetical protein V4439_00225 [Patescibacteria group bacterium]
MEFSKRNIILWVVVVIVLIVSVYSFLHFNNSNEIGIPASKKVNPVAKPVLTGALPLDTSTLSAADKKAYDELAKWVDIKITNQPTVSKNPQTVKLPADWTAREDYLLTVVPSKMPANIRNFRSVIMRPSRFKILSREDAIYSVPDATDPYFKDHCHAGTVIVCYGGKNPEVKHVFDLMFYFNK